MDRVFVNGLVKSKEKYLLPFSSFIRSAESESFTDAVKILKENGFGFEGEVSPSEYEAFVSYEWDKFFDFFKKYSPFEWFTKAFTAKFDFFNAEYAVREVFASAGEDGYMEEGIVKISDLKSYAKDGKAEIPEYLKTPIDLSKKEFTENTATGKSIAVIFKRAYCKFMLKTVKSKDYKEFIFHEIDALNLSVALRSKTEKEAKEQFIEGGKISEKTLLKIVKGEGEKAVYDLKRTEYGELLLKGLSEKKEGKALTGFERKADDFAMDKLKEKRFESEGITPLLLYCYYKLAEIKNARIVLAAKASGIGKEEIVRRLRSGYAG